jgi:serine/threonine protein kinase
MTAHQQESRSTVGRAGPVPDLAPGARLGPYLLLELLGKGGMGTVYRARHEKLKRLVALKVLAAERTGDRRAVARFGREMEAVGQLDHPHLVRAFDAGEADGHHYLAMEHVEGLDLAALVALLGPLPVAEACELIRQAALGLQYIHEHGMVHRDVKPSNLMATADGQVKVLDLGIALLYGEHFSGEELTATGQVMGTASYMAPEQGMESHAVDIRADIYSLGCTLYKLLTAQTPFGGPAYNSFYKKVKAHAEETLPGVAGFRSDVPAELLAVLDRLLAKAPADRPATPAEAAAALAPFAAGADLPRLVTAARTLAVEADAATFRQGPPEVRSLSTADHRPDTITPAVSTIGPSAATSGTTTRRRLLRWGGLAALLLAVLVAGAALLRPGAADPGGAEGPRPPPASTPAPGVWHPLLDREPVRLRWPAKPDRGTYLEHSGERREVRLGCTGLGLLRLGKAAAPRYEIKITVRQTPWAGNVGLFLGYQIGQTGEPLYQVIQLLARARRGEQFFCVEWKSVRLNAAGRENSAHRAQSPDFRLSTTEHRLGVRIGAKGLEAVTWDGQPLEQLSPPRAATAPDASWRGAFGVYAFNGNGIFSDAAYLFQE